MFRRTADYQPNNIEPHGSSGPIGHVSANAAVQATGPSEPRTSGSDRRVRGGLPLPHGCGADHGRGAVHSCGSDILRPAWAFTLVEVLIIVVLLGVLAGVVMPSLGDSRALRLREAARLVAADLEFAQSDSIAHGDEPRTVKFDLSTGRYWIAPAGTAQPPVAGEARGTPVFSTSAGAHANTLNNQIISTGVRSLFQSAGYTLSNDARVYTQQKNLTWRLNDWGSSFLLGINGGQLTAVRDEPFMMTLGTGRASGAGGVSIQTVNSAHANEIRFDAYGAPDQPTDATVALTSGPHGLIVRVKAGTGAVSIE